MPWTMVDDQFPSNDGSQPLLQRIDANVPPQVSILLSCSFIFSNVSTPLTPSTMMAVPGPGFSRRRPSPQRIDGSAPAPALCEIELRLKSVRNIEKITKVWLAVGPHPQLS